MVDFTGSDHAPVWLDLNIDKPTSSKESMPKLESKARFRAKGKGGATADCHFIHSIKPLMRHSQSLLCCSRFHIPLPLIYERNVAQYGSDG